MDIFLMLLLIVLGLILIIRGGDMFVNSSVYIARIAHAREVIIGATIVSIGTTLPELFSSVIATINGIKCGGDEGYFALAISNAVGSMMCNSGLILAIVLLIKPPKINDTKITKTMLYVFVISLFVTIFIFTNSRVDAIEGIVLLIAFIMFMVFSVINAKKNAGEITEEELKLYQLALRESKMRNIASFVVGLVAIAFGAVVLVSNAKALAIRANISEQLVGVTLVAVGTSLPELVTSITSLKKGSSDIGVGNIMGAHIINATLIIGIIAVMVRGGIVVDSITRNVSIWVLLAIMAVLILPTLATKRFSRWQGAMMLCIYLIMTFYNMLLVIK